MSLLVDKSVSDELMAKNLDVPAAKSHLEAVRMLLENNEVDVAGAKRAWHVIFKVLDSPLFSPDREMLLLGDRENVLYARSPNALRGLLAFIDEHNQKEPVKFMGIQFGRICFEEPAWRAFVDGTVYLRELEALHFIGCPLSLPHVQYFMRQGSHLKSRLKMLSIDESDLTGPCLKEFVSFLERNNTLIALSLQNCGISDGSMRDLMEGLMRNRSIQELDLTSNYIGEEGAYYLGLWIREKDSLEQLILKNNELTDDALKCLALFTKDRKLVELDISENAAITHEGVKRLLQDAKQLRVLNVMYNYLVASPKILKFALQHEKLTELKLGRTGISDEAITRFQTMQVKVPSWRELKMSFIAGEGLLSEEVLHSLQDQYVNTAVKIYLIERKGALRSKCGDLVRVEKSEDLQLEDPLFNEIQAAEVPTQELLDKIRNLQHPEEEKKRYIKEACFKALLEKEYDILSIDPDGNCFFAAVAECIGHQAKNEVKNRGCKDHLDHLDLRAKVVAYERAHMLEQAEFLYDQTGDTPHEKLQNYCNFMSKPKVWADEMELEAMVGVLRGLGINRPLWIFDLRGSNRVENGKICIPPGMIKGEDLAGEPILLYFSSGVHYSAMFKKQEGPKRPSQEEGSDSKRQKTPQPMAMA